MSKLIRILFFLLVGVSITSCGDLFTKKEKEKQISSSQFSTCKFDTKALSKILTKNIKGEILCIEKNLKLFIEVVETEKRGYLGQDELISFIKQNLNNIDEKVIMSLKGMFELNSLLFGDDVKYIQQSNVSKLMEIMIEFNSIVVSNNLYEYFTSDDVISFELHNKRKSIIYNSTTQLVKMISKYLVDNNKKVNFIEFLNKYRNEDNAEFLDNSESLLFIKKALVGGENHILSASELNRFISMAADLSKVVYDFVNLPDTIIDNYQDEEIITILKEDFGTLNRNLFYGDSNTIKLFSFNDLKKVADIFFSDFSDYFKYKDSILKIKEIFLGSSDENFSAGELYRFINDLVYKNLNRGTYIYRTFNANKNYLTSPEQIFLNLPGGVNLTAEEEDFRNDFNRIIKSYRFFKGEELAPLYDKDFSRNARGLFEIAVLEDIVTRIFASYGTHNIDAVKQFTISQKILGKILTDFAPILEGENFILPGRALNTAETITLMTSLFHPQSDGDAIIEIPEFTEFGITMLTAIDLANVMHDYLKSVCPLDENKRYPAQCYRDNFLSVLNLDYKGKFIKDFVPNLYNFLAESHTNVVAEYLVQTGKFSRTCSTYNDGSEIPMKWGDAVVSWAGLLAIEQSMVRFDENNTNILEPREVDEVYLIYKSAVQGLIPVNFLKSYSKTFFQYVVKYKKIPQVQGSSMWRAIREGGHFVKFMFSSNKRVSADRSTYAAVLKIIAENSPSRKTNPFNCDTLK